ncbi:MAG: 3-dehydroquinate synthase [Bacteroidetes bacterium]|nr:MAG: 3-dehydroquinate synthase [Bacteroidota bacterium]
MSSILKVHLRKTVDDSYNIYIGMNFSNAVKHISSLKLGSKYFIITDRTVKKLYGNQLLKLMYENGLNASLLSIPAGESYKNRQTKEWLENQLLNKKAGRDSVIIGLGGGVVGDISGFVAATLHRGVPFIQIPTSLLAQVDSSIGGKVAVDHPKGKNLIGAFYQPRAVYIDPAILNTLPDQEFYNGMAEVIKYAAIMDKNLFAYLEKKSNIILQRDSQSLLKIIKRCCELKRYVVERDEKETGLRRILNFGHTIGHAIELLMKYKISHGQAIAIGMVAETKISASLGLVEPDAVQCLEYMLRLYHLPTFIPSATNLPALFRLTLQDKKSKAGVVHYTLLEEIGKAKVGVALTEKEALTRYKQ